MKGVGDALFPVAPALRLATARVMVGGFCVAYLLVRAQAHLGVVEQPARRFDPVGPVAWLDGPLPGGVVVFGWALTIALGVAFTFGVRYRVTAPAFATVLTLLCAYRHSWEMIFHTDNAMVLHVVALACAPAADTWSVDARDKPVPADDRAYGWAWRACALVLVATYVVAGIAKLRASGLAWAGGSFLREQIATDNLRKIELGDLHSPLGAYLVQFDWLFPPIAALTLAVEIAAPLALLGPRVARIWVATVWGFHAGVLALMMIVFPYPLFGVAFVGFFRVERLATDPRVRRLLGPLAPRQALVAGAPAPKATSGPELGTSDRAD